MPHNLAEVQDLDYWLRYISSVHPRDIELGLDRIRLVANNLGIEKLAPQVVVVAGTNGKGSCVISMEEILLAADYKTASYTSPHIHRYAERIKLNGSEVNAETLCAAFEKVELCREGVSLSYFEFSTLAALWIFFNSDIDVVLLEIGLGGRLDAVNIVDGDVTIISSIGMDHQDWLGDSLELIGAEKAVILRKDVPLVYGDEYPLESILNRAHDLNVPLYIAGQQISWEISKASSSFHWHGERNGIQTSLSELPLTNIYVANIGLALQALFLLGLELPDEKIKHALGKLSNPGRQELRNDVETNIPVLLDVAHSPAAMELLAINLKRKKAKNPALQKISAVMAVMADKDIEGMAAALESTVDFWYIAQVEEPRCMPVEEVAGWLEQNDKIKGFLVKQGSVVAAYDQACKASAEFEEAHPGKESLVIVVGSFYTVAAVRELSKTVG